MSTHKHSEAGNELRSLSMIRYDKSMNATAQISKDSHFWHLTPLPAHRQVHTSHTPTSGTDPYKKSWRPPCLHWPPAVLIMTRRDAKLGYILGAVSYTHLTLPTILRV